MPVTDYITCLPLTAELGQVKSNAKTWKSLFITNMPSKIVLNCGVLYHGMINPGMAWKGFVKGLLLKHSVTELCDHDFPLHRI